MKKKIFISCLLLVATMKLIAQQKDLLKLAGPYLGQKSPGTKPEIFASGFISTTNSEHGTAAFSPKGDEVF